jgi:hypothetical protein
VTELLSEAVEDAAFAAAAGRLGDWLKTKCHQTGTFVITGFSVLASGRLEAVYVDCATARPAARASSHDGGAPRQHPDQHSLTSGPRSRAGDPWCDPRLVAIGRLPEQFKAVIAAAALCPARAGVVMKYIALLHQDAGSGIGVLFVDFPGGANPYPTPSPTPSRVM